MTQNITLQEKPVNRRICACGNPKGKKAKICTECLRKIIDAKRIETVLNIRSKPGLTWKQKYILYSNTKHWEFLRKRKLDSSDRKCESCGSSENLNVHHIRYKNWYDVELSDLQIVCRPCHDRHHAEEEKRDGVVSPAGALYIGRN